MSEFAAASYNYQHAPDPQVLREVGLNPEVLLKEHGIRLDSQELRPPQPPQFIDLDLAVPLRTYKDGQALVAVIDVAGVPVEVCGVPDIQHPGRYYDVLWLYRAHGAETDAVPGMVFQDGANMLFGRQEGHTYRRRLRLGNERVSRNHFVITGAGRGRYEVRDVGSGNGTRLITGVRDASFYEDKTALWLS